MRFSDENCRKGTDLLTIHPRFIGDSLLFDSLAVGKERYPRSEPLAEELHNPDTLHRHGFRESAGQEGDNETPQALAVLWGLPWKGTS